MGRAGIVASAAVLAVVVGFVVASLGMVITYWWAFGVFVVTFLELWSRVS